MTRCGDMAIQNSISREVYLRSQFFGEGEVVWVVDRSRTTGKSDGGFLYALHCDHCAISDRSATICHRMSATLNSTGGGSLWVKVLGCSIGVRTSPMLRSAEIEHLRLTKREIILKISYLRRLRDHDTSTSRTYERTASDFAVAIYGALSTYGIAVIISICIFFCIFMTMFSHNTYFTFTDRRQTDTTL